MSQISETEPFQGKQTIVNINNTLEATQEFQTQKEEPIKINEQDIKIQKPKRPLSAYFFFVQNYKKDYPNDARQLKELGGMWKDLSHDYKEKYLKMQEQERKRYQQELQEWIQKQPEEKDEDEISKEVEITTHFPVHRIKYILKHDEDKVTYTKDGYIALQKAVEIFATNLLNSCKAQAELNKRKKLVDDDLFLAIREKDEYEFLNCLISKEPTQAEKNVIQVELKEKIKIPEEKSPQQQQKQNNDERKPLTNQKNTLLNYFKKV